MKIDPKGGELKIDMKNSEVSAIVQDILLRRDFIDGHKGHNRDTMRTVLAVTLDALERCQWVKPSERLPTLWDSGPDGSVLIWYPDINDVDTRYWWEIDKESTCLWAAMPMYAETEGTEKNDC